MRRASLTISFLTAMLCAGFPALLACSPPLPEPPHDGWQVHSRAELFALLKSAVPPPPRPRRTWGRIAPPFWETARQVDIVIEPTPAPRVWRDGGGFAAEVVYGEKDGYDLAEGLGRVELDLQGAARRLATCLASRGVSARILGVRSAGDLTEEQQPAEAGDSARYVLSLGVVGWGVGRGYIGLVPLGGYRSTVALRGEIQDLGVDERWSPVLWSYEITRQEPVGRDWRQPPEYPGLTASAGASLSADADYLCGKLLRWKGTRVTGETKVSY